MAENREDGEEENLRPVELETHRFTPPPMDPEQQAEISKLSAEIDEADNWELTIEIVEVEKSPPREYPSVLATPDLNLDLEEGSGRRRKSKTPNSSGKKNKTRSPLIPLEIENNTPESNKSKTGTPTSIENRILPSPLLNYCLEEENVESAENDENAMPQAPKKLVPRRKSVAQKLAEEMPTPTSSRKRKSVADELSEMFGTPRSSKKKISKE